MWVTPKTTWEEEHYYNYSDYNRQKNNILFLYDYFSAIYPNITKYVFGEDKNYSSMLYADEFNLIEDALMVLDKETFKVGFNRKIWRENQKLPTYEDFNRIEEKTKQLYELAKSKKSTIPILSFTLKRQKGMR